MLTEQHADTSKSIDEASGSNVLLVFTCWGYHEGKMQHRADQKRQKS